MSNLLINAYQGIIIADSFLATCEGAIEEKVEIVTQGIWEWNSVYDGLNQVFMLTI